MVAVDGHGRPVAAPVFTPQNATEQCRWDAALKRKAARQALASRA